MKKIVNLLKIKRNFIFGISIGVIIAFGFTVAAQSTDDAWIFGNDWLWFKKASDNNVKANVDVPIDGYNIVNKNYVDAFAGTTANPSSNIICTSFNCGTGKCGVVCCGPSNSESKKTSCKVYTEDQWKDSVLF